jgi:hypothetical protein
MPGPCYRTTRGAGPGACRARATSAAQRATFGPSAHSTITTRSSADFAIVGSGETAGADEAKTRRSRSVSTRNHDPPGGENTSVA